MDSGTWLSFNELVSGAEPSTDAFVVRYEYHLECVRVIIR